MDDKLIPATLNAESTIPCMVIAACCMLLLGAFNNIGISAFARTTALVYALGLSPLVAFPIMMGACACSLAVGSAEFVKLKNYARKPTLIFLIPERRTYLKETYQVEVTNDSITAAGAADIIFIAVRPQNAEESLLPMKTVLNGQQIIISICAGIDLERFQEWIGTDKKLVRVMPNVLIEARNGYSGVCISDQITETDKNTISALPAIIVLSP